LLRLLTIENMHGVYLNYEEALAKFLDDQQNFEHAEVELLTTGFKAGWDIRNAAAAPFAIDVSSASVLAAINNEFENRFLNNNPVTLIQRTTRQWFDHFAKEKTVSPAIPSPGWMGRVFCELERQKPDRFRSKSSQNGKIWRVTGKAGLARFQD
jgi:hypothetical protein